MMPQWLEVLLWTGAALTALGAVWKYGIRPMLTLIRAGLDLSADMKDLRTIVPLVRTISAEFAPNDGESLRDRVDINTLMIGELQTAVEKRITTHDHYHQGWENRITKLEEDNGI